MPLSLKDNTAVINTYIENNKIIQTTFGNLFITALILTVIFFSIYFFVYNRSNHTHKLFKSFLYCLISSLMILVVHNKIVKLNYKEKIKSKLDNEFIDMMNNNANSLALNNDIKKDMHKIIDGAIDRNPHRKLNIKFGGLDSDKTSELSNNKMLNEIHDFFDK